MQCFAFALYLQIFAISFSFTFQCPNISGIIVVLLYSITGHSECSLIRPSLNAVFIKELCQPQRYYVIYLAAKIVIQTFPNASTWPNCNHTGGKHSNIEHLNGALTDFTHKYEFTSLEESYPISNNKLFNVFCGCDGALLSLRKWHWWEIIRIFQVMMSSGLA